MPRATGSTLFPYTTLFRSNENSKAEVLYRGIAARAFERAFQLADFVQVKNASLENGLLHVDLVDRKSTRLNSSHQIISYAVFCLKKKTHEYPRPPDGRRAR